MLSIALLSVDKSSKSTSENLFEMKIDTSPLSFFLDKFCSQLNSLNVSVDIP